MLQVSHIAGNDRSQQACAHHQVHVGGVLRPANRVVAQYHVADGAPAQRGDKGNHDHTKNIHICAAQRPARRTWLLP